jgi:hypothetical protein
VVTPCAKSVGARNRRANARRVSVCRGGEKGCCAFPRTPFSAERVWPPLRSVLLDEAEHFLRIPALPAQSKSHRRYAPKTVRLRPGMPFAFPSESAFTFAGVRSYSSNTSDTSLTMRTRSGRTPACHGVPHQIKASYEFDTMRGITGNGAGRAAISKICLCLQGCSWPLPRLFRPLP